MSRRQSREAALGLLLLVALLLTMMVLSAVTADVEPDPDALEQGARSWLVLVAFLLFVVLVGGWIVYVGVYWESPLSLVGSGKDIRGDLGVVLRLLVVLSLFVGLMLVLGTFLPTGPGPDALELDAKEAEAMGKHRLAENLRQQAEDARLRARDK